MPENPFDTAVPVQPQATGGNPFDSAQPSQEAWQTRVKPFRLPNGQQTVMREDGRVWLDPSKGIGIFPQWNTDRGWVRVETLAPSNGGYVTGDQPTLDRPESAKPKERNHLAYATLTNPFMMGVTDPAMGVIQAAGNVVGMGDVVNTAAREREKAYQEDTAVGPWTKALHRMAGNAVPFILTGGGSSMAQGIPLLTRMAGAAGQGGLAALTQPVVVPEGQEGDYWGEKAKQGVTGAALGAALPAAAAAAKGTVRGAKGLASRMLGGAANASEAENASAIQQLADRFGIRLSWGDASGKPNVKKAEVFLESVPGSGMGAFRHAQDQEARVAAQQIVDRLGREMSDTPHLALPRIQAAADSGDKGAQYLLQEIKAAGDDWTRILQTSGKAKLFGEKLKANDLYASAEQLAPKSDMPAPQAIGVLKSAQAQLEALPESTRNNKLLGFIRQLRSDLESAMPGQAKPKLVREYDPVTKTFSDSMVSVKSEGPAFDASYSGMGRLRSFLRNLREDANRGAGELTGTDTGHLLGQVKSALEDDMEAFANREGGAFAQARKDADAFYRTRVVPFKDKALAQAFNGQEPDQIYGQFIKAGKGDRAQNFYNALDTRGQAAVRYGMVQEAMQKATNEGAASGEAAFSPAKFAGYLRNLQDASGVFFKGQDKFELDGFVKLMDHIRRAGQFAENPPTGARLAANIPMLGIGTQAGGAAMAALTGHPMVAAANTAAIGAEMLTARGLQRLFTTPGGKRFLMQAASAKPGSATMQALTAKLPAIIGAESAQPSTSPQEVQP